MLVIGVNGSGKTTTIGKLGHWLQEQDYGVMLAAGLVFTFQGLGYLEGSPMTGVQIWAVLGQLNVPNLSTPPQPIPVGNQMEDAFEQMLRPSGLMGERT